MSAAYDATYRPSLLMPKTDYEDNDTTAPYGTHHYSAEENSDDFSMDDGLDRISENPTAFIKFSDHLADVGSKFIEGGKQLYLQQRQSVEMGEGPTLIRFLCFVGGLVMVLSSTLSMINVFSLFTGPSTYVLQIYQGFFGLITMIVEAKDWDCLDQLKPWLTEWFRFLTVPAGKGAFYMFVGTLGISLWVRNFLAFTVGLYMSAMGLICIAVHAGASRNKYNDDLDAEIREGYNIRGLTDPMTNVLDQTFNTAGIIPGVRKQNGYYKAEDSDKYMQSRQETSTAASGRHTRPMDIYQP